MTDHKNVSMSCNLFVTVFMFVCFRRHWQQFVICVWIPSEEHSYRMPLQVGHNSWKVSVAIFSIMFSLLWTPNIQLSSPPLYWAEGTQLRDWWPILDQVNQNSLHGYKPPDRVLEFGDFGIWLNCCFKCRDWGKQIYRPNVTMVPG